MWGISLQSCQNMPKTKSHHSPDPTQNLWLRQVATLLCQFHPKGGDVIVIPGRRAWGSDLSIHSAPQTNDTHEALCPAARARVLWSSLPTRSRDNSGAYELEADPQFCSSASRHMERCRGNNFDVECCEWRCSQWSLWKTTFPFQIFKTGDPTKSRPLWS